MTSGDNNLEVVEVRCCAQHICAALTEMIQHQVFSIDPACSTRTYDI